MATPAQWLEGARPLSLPAALAAVFDVTGVAAALDGYLFSLALLAFCVPLALLDCDNYAKDYT